MPETLESHKERTEILNERIRELLIYIGGVGAVISGLAYILITIVMVVGFKTSFSTTQQILFSVMGVVVGLMITILLRYQGISFAKQLPTSKDILKRYYEAINKDKEEKDMITLSQYMTRALLKDIIIKGLTFLISTYFVLYIAIEGNGDIGLIGLAIANVLFFLSMGLIGLANTYDFYIETHLQTLKEITDRIINREATSLKEESNEIIQSLFWK